MVRVPDEPTKDSKRQLSNELQDAAGNNMPIGVLQNSWVSSEVLNQMALIAIQEVLGFHARMHPQNGQSSASTIYALGGCLNFDSYEDRRCGSETTVHVSMDSWIRIYMSALFGFQSDYPSLAPVDLGSMGYDAEEGLFVSRAAIDAASGSSGLPLDFFRTYNFSGHNVL